MSFKTIICHTVHCDHCGEPLEGGDYVRHFEDPDEGIDEAEECEWTVTANRRVYCLATNCQLAAPVCECEQRGCDSLGCVGKCGCDRCDTDPPVVNPQRATTPTRKELIAKATEIHNREGCRCDPKYLMSCGKFAAAILRAPEEINRG